MGASQTHSTPALSRRGFLGLAGSAALVGGAAAAASGLTGLRAEAQADEAPSEEIKFGTCHGNCIGGCRFKYTLRDGVVAKSEMAPYPQEHYNRICTKGLSHSQRTYSPRRVQYPMRRVEGTPRGGGQWERISWDQAIDEITGKWKEYIEQYGPESIGFSASGGNVGMQMNAYLNGMATLFGWSTIPNQADQAGVYTILQYLGIGACFVGNEGADIANAHNIFIFGDNPALSQLHCSTFIWEAKKKGAQVISIDPNFTPSVAAYADRHIPLRPATDACLFMAMSHVVIDEGLVDEEFMRTMTVAPFLVKKSDGLFLRAEEAGIEAPVIDAEDPTVVAASADIVVARPDGSVGLANETTDQVLSGSFVVNGHEVVTAYDLLIARLNEWPIAKCSEICDVDEDTIRELALVYADGPTTTMMHYGADHYTNGHTAYEALIVLAALTGNLLKRGGSVMQGGLIAGLGLAGANAWMAQFSTGEETTGSNAIGVNVGSVNIAATQLKEFFDTGKVNGQQVGPDGFKLVSWDIACMNPVGGACNRAEILDVMDQMELIVVQDIMWNESAMYADYVLPVCYYTEYEDVGSACAVPAWNLQDKCIDPLFEAKTDYEIMNLFAEKLGFSEYVCPSYEEWLQFSFDNSALAQAHGLTLDRMREEKTFMPLVPEDGGTYVQMPTNALQKVAFYQEIPFSNNAWPGDFDVELERMVHWEPPLEAWPYDVGGYSPSEAARKYPLSFHWKRSRYSTHTNYGVGSHWLDEVDPEPFVRINPDDAAVRGIAEGDLVRVHNDRGYCIIRAHLDAGLRPGAMDSPQRWQGMHYREGSMCDMSNHASHPFILNANYNECQVEVEKYEEA